METRKNFIIKGAALTAAALIPGCSSSGIKYAKRPFKTRRPKKALIAWYGQTGNTERYARLIGHLWKKEGIAVDVLEYREVKIETMKDYDIILVGAPIYYYDTPENVHGWLKKIPEIKGAAVASYVSFGGPEGNQHNGATHLLEILAEKGGVPVGIDYFMNMSTFPPPKWDTGGTIGHKHLPNENTYDRVRKYARQILSNVKEDKKIIVDGEADMREMLRVLPMAGMTKLYYRDHKIDKKTCINCGTCEEVCPVGAISPKFDKVDRDKCIFCFGCFNNCPVQAVKMKAGSTQLYNFPEFMKRNKIEIKEPEELI